MPQRKVVDIFYYYAPLSREYRTAHYFTWTKTAWSDQSRVRLGTALLVLITGALWHEEQLHGCILRLQLSLQPHPQQGSVLWAVDDSVTLK